MPYTLRGKRILVTGACGTIGSQLVAELLENPAHDPREVCGVDNNETEIFALDQKYASDKRARLTIGDVRDLDLLVRTMKGIDVVFHLAALKHVIISERSPIDAVQTNVIGVQNVVRAATECDVQRVVFTSSDKAVNPTSVMGTSKLLGERLMTAANGAQRNGRPVFISTRFGNVLGSRGSVVPLFVQQIAAGGPVTLTDPGMTRFVMSTAEAVRLVIESSAIGRGGEVFVTKMRVMRIADLAHVLITNCAPQFNKQPQDIEVVEIGAKPGEKLYEELMSEEEARRAVELARYYVILPAFRDLQTTSYEYADTLATRVATPYVSATAPALDRAAVAELLEEYGLSEGATATTRNRGARL